MTAPSESPGGGARRGNFIRDRIDADLRAGTYGGRVVTRFPPEPNGYLHIGHAKSICLNFGIARDYGGRCHLRFDDTNPTTEDPHYVEAIQRDVRWLGFEWGEHLYFASDYFETLYGYAERLIERGLAYVCSLDEDAIRESRGTLGTPGRESPYRERPVSENLDLFRRMRAGEFADGAHVLRAKIDMAASNMKLRDPLLYRIRHAHHYRAGDAWCIYPMYDFAHPLSDAIEGVTHSICTLEFENNRPLYDWVVAAVGFDEPPVQLEFARLNLDYTVMSKRKLLHLVEEGYVSDWADPRMPTIAGFRRRGYTPEAIRSFCDLIGVAKTNSVVDIGKLEYSARDDLNYRAPRVMGVSDPLPVTIRNYPEDHYEDIDAPSFPPDVGREGSRPVPFSREILIERDDFAEDPPKGFKRLAPGRAVRLRYAYAITCEEVVKSSETGAVERLVCRYDPASRGGAAGEGPKPRGVIHWVDAARSVPAELRLYDRLFQIADPEEAGDVRSALNPHSVIVREDARVEPSLAGAEPLSRYQFERKGYFAVAPDATADALALNRIVTLRDSWARAGAAAERESNARGQSRPEASAKAPPPGDKSASQGGGASSSGGAAPESKGAAGRPAKRSRAEQRRRARERDPDLASRYPRYRDELGLGDEDADLLTGDPAVAELFETAARGAKSPKTVANLVVNEVLPAAREAPEGEAAAAEVGPAPEALAEIAALIDEGTITPTLAKDVIAKVREGGERPRAIVRERGLEQIADPDSLRPLIDQVLADHPAQVESYRGGKTGLLGFFVGRVMKATAGKANAERVRELLRTRLEDESS